MSARLVLGIALSLHQRLVELQALTAIPLRSALRSGIVIGGGSGTINEID